MLQPGCWRKRWPGRKGVKPFCIGDFRGRKQGGEFGGGKMRGFDAESKDDVRLWGLSRQDVLKETSIGFAIYD